MNRQEFIRLLSAPESIDAEALKKLEEMASSFPYCQVAHILIAKSCSDHGSMMAGKKIKKAAAYTSDRKTLKRLLEKKTEAPEVREAADQKKQTEYNTGPGLPESRSAEESVSPPPLPESQVSQEQKKEPDQGIYSEIRENLEKLKSLRPLIIEDQTWVKPEEDPEEEETDGKEAVSAPKAGAPEEIPEEILGSPASIEESFPEIKTEDQELLTGYLDYLNNTRKKARRDPEKINRLIEKFIQEDPMISPLKPKQAEEPKDLAKHSVKASGPVSETFAKILAGQGKFEKAIGVYEQLILKYPEKTAYFASLIEDLKNKLKE